MYVLISHSTAEASQSKTLNLTKTLVVVFVLILADQTSDHRLNSFSHLNLDYSLTHKTAKIAKVKKKTS